jgi:hypothetical protein
MRKVINGRTYNTETSKVIGTWDNNYPCNDFHSCEETLYKNAKGAYFLYGEGGPMSKYAKSAGQNSWTGGKEITPLTREEAQEWAEEHLDVDEYEAEFGMQEEAAPSDLTTRERVNFTIDTEIMARLRKYSADTGIPMARILDKAILAVLDKEGTK